MRLSSYDTERHSPLPHATEPPPWRLTLPRVFPLQEQCHSPQLLPVDMDCDVLECLVCGEELNLYMIGNCNHRQVCAICATRMRVLYKDKSCLVCKAELKKVIVTKSALQPFHSYELKVRRGTL